MQRRIGMAVTIGLLVGCSDPSGPMLADEFDQLLRETMTAREVIQGAALHVDTTGEGLEYEGAVGPSGAGAMEPMTALHSVRIASNTKTYVAAAALRLWEDGRLDLDAPVGVLLPADLGELLTRGGYDPSAITVRHLLTHTSGLDDHGNDAYGAAILADPQRRWTRTDQVRICVEEGTRQGEPGEVFWYSDTGYVLLGAILEGITGENLAGAVWSMIDREALGLAATWFETLEPRPEGVAERAHQFFGETDVTGFNPSFDLWGGGGIACTVGDLARFTRALFTGGVFERPETLDVMLSTFEGLGVAPSADEGTLPPGAYRMGLWVTEVDGLTVYRHTGFWCTSANYVPDLDLVVTATVNQHEAKQALTEIVDGAIRLVARRHP
jgi:D-alanyl-D-alanine carboxypeptidase